MSENRVELAEEFLREAVYRSRAGQAVATLLAKRTTPNQGNCGLGERASVALDLTPRAKELFEQLFADDDERTMMRVRDGMRDWIESQDALDRKRNHFLKAFRNQHGFDRTKYSLAQATELDAGLARINDEENRERHSAAETLLRS
jgi:hypothetical protein